MEKSVENACKHVRTVFSRNGIDWDSGTEYETMYERMPKPHLNRHKRHAQHAATQN